MTKLLSVKDEVYEYLKSIKKEKESFSDLLINVERKRKYPDISRFNGILAGNKEAIARLDEVLKERREKKERVFK